MMAILPIAPAALAGALLFRVRGGLGGEAMRTSTQEARLLYAGGMAILSMIALQHPLGVALLPLWLLDAIPGWAHSVDLGRNEGTWRLDAIRLTVRGLLFSGPVALVLLALPLAAHWWPGLPMPAAWWRPLLLLGAGLLILPAYELGWRTPLRLPGLTQGPQIGEALFGAVLGASLILC